MMAGQVSLLPWLVPLLFVLLAYGIGRRIGRSQGRKRALAEAPLRLRARVLETGRCDICGHRSEAQDS